MTGLGHGFAAFAVSALLKPIAADLDAGRGAVSIAIGLGRAVSGVASPLIGRAADGLGATRVATSGMALTALGLAALGFVDSLPGLYLAWSLVISAGVAAGFTVALDKLVVTAVDSSGRGMALAVRFSIAAVVSAMLLPVVVWLIEAVGWRATCFIWAGLFVLLLPVPMLTFPRRDGAGTGVPFRPVSDEAAELLDRPGLRAAMARREYWIIAMAFMAQASVTTGLMVHMVPLMTDTGMEATLAGAIFGAMILLSIPFRLLGGFLCDRVGKRMLPMLLAGLIAGEGVFIGFYALQPGLASMTVLVLALGVAAGTPTLVILVLCAHLFGEHRFATVQGSLMMLQVPGTMAAPVVAGYAFDLTGSYVGAVAGFAALLVLAGAGLTRLRVR